MEFNISTGLTKGAAELIKEEFAPGKHKVLQQGLVSGFFVLLLVCVLFFAGAKNAMASQLIPGTYQNANGEIEIVVNSRGQVESVVVAISDRVIRNTTIPSHTYLRNFTGNCDDERTRGLIYTGCKTANLIEQGNSWRGENEYGITDTRFGNYTADKTGFQMTYDNGVFSGTYSWSYNHIYSNVFGARGNYSNQHSGPFTATNTTAPAVIPVTSVSLNKSSTSLEVDASETLSATVNPSNATNRSVTWSSNRISVATVSSTGRVTAVAPGTAVITVRTVDGGRTATCTVTVTAATVPVTSVSLNKSNTSLRVGASETLSATVNPGNATNRNVTWSSSRTSVATVSSTGRITAVAPGTAVITVKTVDGGKMATCMVTVKEVVAKVVTLEGEIVNGRFLVPMRGIFEALGANVDWDGENNIVTGIKGNSTVILKIDAQKATVSGNTVELDAPATLIRGRTYVPTRFVSESLGANVIWDGGNRIATIKKEGTEIRVNERESVR